MWPRKSSKKKSDAAVLETAARATPIQDVAPSAPVAVPRYRKPTADIYTFLLVIALVALVAGIIALCLEMNLYEFKYKGGPTVGAVIRDDVGRPHLGFRPARSTGA